MNCFYHPGTPAVGQCARPGCGRGLCPDCVFEDRCWEHLKVSIQADYKIAMGRRVRVWIFTAAVTVGLGIALIAGINDGSNPPASIFAVPFIAVGAWLFYMGMSWIYEKLRGRGIAAGGFVSGGRRITDMSSAIDSIWALIAVVAVVTILFVIVSWPIMLIGLFTGFQKYVVDGRVIRMVKTSSWLQMFPGKYNPETRQLIASAPMTEPETEPESVI